MRGPVIPDERRLGFAVKDREHEAAELALGSGAADTLERADGGAAVHGEKPVVFPLVEIAELDLEGVAQIH